MCLNNNSSSTSSWYWHILILNHCAKHENYLTASCVRNLMLKVKNEIIKFQVYTFSCESINLKSIWIHECYKEQAPSGIWIAASIHTWSSVFAILYWLNCDAVWIAVIDMNKYISTLVLKLFHLVNRTSRT